MFKSLLVLVLVFSFSPFAFGMDPYLEFFTMDVFFDYKTPEDPELDRLFHEFYVGLSTQHYDDFDVAEFLRNGGDPLAKYLRARDELVQLRNNIMQLLKINNFRGVNTDSDYEVVVSELLQIINFSDNTLNYLKPILRKYENYVLLLSNDEQ